MTSSLQRILKSLYTINFVICNGSFRIEYIEIYPYNLINKLSQMKHSKRNISIEYFHYLPVLHVQIHSRQYRIVFAKNITSDRVAKRSFIIFRVMAAHECYDSYVFDCKDVNLLSSHTALALDKHIFEIGLSQILFTVIYCTVRNNMILFCELFLQ